MDTASEKKRKEQYRRLNYWNHRCVMNKNGEFGICEVYYDDYDQIVSWTEKPVAAMGDTPSELKSELQLMISAITSKPILKEEAEEKIVLVPVEFDGLIPPNKNDGEEE